MNIQIDVDKSSMSMTISAHLSDMSGAIKNDLIFSLQEPISLKIEWFDIVMTNSGT